MKKYIPVFIFWILDTVLLFLANMLYPSNYVLGNAFLIPLYAAVVAGLVWTLIVWQAMPFAKKVGIKEKDMVKMAIFYLAINFIALWVIARLSFFFGFGVISFIWVFALAFVANILQWLTWSFVAKK